MFLMYTAYSQSESVIGDSTIIRRPQQVYVELGGSGLYASINFENRISKSKLIETTWSTGAGFLTPFFGQKMYSINSFYHVLIGRSINRIEVNAGAAFLWYTNPPPDEPASYLVELFAFKYEVGYRLDISDRLVFRALYSPFIGFDGSRIGYANWAALSIGYKF